MRSGATARGEAHSHYFPWSATPVRVDPGSPYLKVRFGQSTFDAEGTEMPGPFFSRHISWPGGHSGVTLGRGYDMGQRTQLQVARELMAAGMRRPDAIRLAAGAGLRGRAAELFVKNRETTAPIIDLSVQQRLFEEITTPEVIADIKRILSKPETEQKYGSTSWNDLPTTVKEFLFDLRYRGDYTPKTREIIQPLISSGRFEDLALVAQDEERWVREFGVPAERASIRASMFRDRE